MLSCATGPPDPNVSHIIDLICQVFGVESALLALFDDRRRIYIRWRLVPLCTRACA